MTDTNNSTDRYARQVALFGAEGQTLIEDASVAVVGAGGLGSHVCQQLAYLGVQRFTVIDHDKVAETNLNRLIGATISDVGTLKVGIAKRMIEWINPDAEVVPVEEKLPHPDVTTAMTSVAVVFGCLDNDYPRMLLTELCADRQLPYIDCSSGVNPVENHPPFYGGRVLVAGTSVGCLHCLNLLSQREIRVAQMTPQERRSEAATYGVPEADLTESGPSVVNINGVVASLAVMEFMALVTGLRDPFKQVKFQGGMGSVGRNTDKPVFECPYCRRWGLGTSD